MIVIKCRSCNSTNLKIIRTQGGPLAHCQDCSEGFRPNPIFDWKEVRGSESLQISDETGDKDE